MRPSGAMATDEIQFACPVNVRIIFPLAKSQCRRVLSPLPDTAVRPSGEIATERTLSVCPVNVRMAFPVGKSQSSQSFVFAS